MHRKMINILILALLVLSASVFPGKANANGSVIDIAKQYLGTPYKYGGTTPAGFDCSGFVQFVYKQAGVNLPRATTSQWGVGKAISKSELQPGDLVFFSGTYRSGISHDGIYVGNNQFIHSSSSGVVITSLSTNYWGPKYSGARRVSGGLVAVKPDTSKDSTKASTTKKNTTKKATTTTRKATVVKPQPEKTVVITQAKQYVPTLKEMEFDPYTFEVMISNDKSMSEVISFESDLFEADKVIFINQTAVASEVPKELVDQLKKENIKIEIKDYEQAQKDKILDKVGKENYSFMFYGDQMPKTLQDTVIESKFADLTMMLRKYGMDDGMQNLMQVDKTMYYTVVRGITLEALYN